MASVRLENITRRFNEITAIEKITMVSGHDSGMWRWSQLFAFDPTTDNTLYP